MLDDKKTIFALATHPGKSGVAIIRISGQHAVDAIQILTKSDVPVARYASLKLLLNPIDGQVIDEAIVLFFPGPNSFTGEDIVELHIHGSIAVVNILITSLSKFSNFRLANPGEFAKRAFLNGKMDLTEAEGLADLIEAETLMQQQQAVKQMQGKLADFYEKWRFDLIRTLALIEAYLDFPDEDIPEEIFIEVTNLVTSLKESISLHLNDQNRGEILRRGIYTAIIGSPNVGKSSLLNYLAKRDVAIVSHVAGTTRDIIEVHLDLNGYPVTIADTAGIRDSEDLIEQEGITRALNKAKHADIKIILLAADNAQSYSEDIRSIIDENSLIIINKIDLPDHQLDQMSNIIRTDLVKISVNKNIGLDDFLAKLTTMIEQRFSVSVEPLITRERHRNHLQSCLENLMRFDFDKSLELACEDLRLAARSLGQITGIIEVEMILDQIFRNFCIGK